MMMCEKPNVEYDLFHSWFFFKTEHNATMRAEEPIMYEFLQEKKLQTHTPQHYKRYTIVKAHQKNEHTLYSVSPSISKVIFSPTVHNGQSKFV